MTGLVYFIHDASSVAVKIGWSLKNVRGRFASAQTHNPNKLVLLGVTSGSLDDEADWHRKFADCRIRGEWFQATPFLLSEIENSIEVQAVSVELTGNPITDWRILKQMTVKDFAELIGVQDSAVCKWERGRVSSKKALKVHQVTGIPLHRLRPDIYPKAYSAESEGAAA